MIRSIHQTFGWKGMTAQRKFFKLEEHRPSVKIDGLLKLGCCIPRKLFDLELSTVNDFSSVCLERLELVSEPL